LTATRGVLEQVSGAIDRLGGELARPGVTGMDARFEVQRWRRLTLIDGLVVESAIVDLSVAAVGLPGSPQRFAAVDDLDAASEQLAMIRRLSPPLALPARTPVVDHDGLRPLPDWPDLDTVAGVLATYHDVALEVAPETRSYRSFYEDRRRIVWYGSSDGTSIVQTFTDASLIATIRTRRLERTGFSFASVAAANPDGLLSSDAPVRDAAAQARHLLEAEAVEPGPTTVVLDPHMTGMFAHEALGHLCEADYLRERPEVAALMAPGRTVASSLLTVVDDPSRAGLRGTYRYDDEGTAARPTVIVEEGRVARYLHSRATAAHFGVLPTGHARAQDCRYTPLVRMANTYVAPGATPFDVMLDDVDDGLYLTRPMGGETRIDSFTFGANEVFRIRGGRLHERVGSVLLVGDLFETLTAVDAVGSELAFETSAGGCAKEDQDALAVDSGGPHLRIRGCQVSPL